MNITDNPGSDISEELINRFSAMKLRVWFCIHKYVIPIIKTYNAGRKPDRPIMTDEWVRGFIVMELLERVKSSYPYKPLESDFVSLLIKQYYNTDRHVKTGSNYEIYLTIVHVLKSNRADSHRVTDPKMIEDMYELVKMINEDN